MWALRQVPQRPGTTVDGALAELEQAAPEIGAALALHADIGWSFRTTWRIVEEGGWTLPDAARAIAPERRFALRVMAGRHTPQAIAAAGPHYVVEGQAVPAPFTAGGAPNMVFEEAYRALVTDLVDYAERHGDPILHLPWYGQDWAELNHGAEVRALPGYSYGAWLGAHTRLIDIAHEVAAGRVPVEWPMSGYGPLHDASHELTAHIVERFGPDSPWVYVQANGWDASREFGAPSADVEDRMRAAVWAQPVRRGLQAIQPWPAPPHTTAPDWTAMFARLTAADAAYAELYTPIARLPADQLSGLAGEVGTFLSERSER